MADDFSWAEDVVANGLGGLKRLNGYYHDNFVAEHDGKKYLIRVKRDSSKDMDFRQLNELDVLHFLNSQKFLAPKLFYISPANEFSVQQFIDGATMSELYPKHLPLPTDFIRQIANNMARLHTIRGLDTLGTVSSGQMFFQRLLDYVSEFYQAIWKEIPEIFAENDFPADPFERFRTYEVSERPAALCHGDIHQHNLIVDREGNIESIVDWELAVIGDSFYDISCHVNRSYYGSEQRDVFLHQYCSSIYGSSLNESHIKDAYMYLAIEYVRSAISDLYRLQKQQQRPAASQNIDHKRNVRIPQQLARARAVWAGSDFKDII
jgi:aminoglycoside phosphotransferase (APT) family kinase protein